MTARRARAALMLAVVFLLCRAGAAPAYGPIPMSEALQDQRQFTTWLFGSGTNPLHRNGFCGELVGGVFFLNVATTPVSKAHCTVPAGVPLLAMPAGAWTWAPTHGTTADELLRLRNWLFDDVHDVSVRVDGAERDLADSHADAGFYPVMAEPGSFLANLTSTPEDPDGLPGAIFTSVGFAVRIPPLSSGPHLVELNSVFAPDVHLHATYELNVSNPDWLIGS